MMNTEKQPATEAYDISRPIGPAAIEHGYRVDLLTFTRYFHDPEAVRRFLACHPSAVVTMLPVSGD